MKRFLIALLFLSSCASQATSQNNTIPPLADQKIYFVTVWTEPRTDDIELMEGEDPGRVEIYEGDDVNNTVACQQFKIIKDWNSEKIAQISFGFRYQGTGKGLKIKLFGAAARLLNFNTKAVENPLAP